MCVFVQVQSQQYAYRSICCTFTDDNVAKTLRPTIEGDERLLRLYETGLQVCFVEAAVCWHIHQPMQDVYSRMVDFLPSFADLGYLSAAIWGFLQAMDAQPHILFVYCSQRVFACNWFLRSLQAHAICGPGESSLHWHQQDSITM